MKKLILVTFGIGALYLIGDAYCKGYDDGVINESYRTGYNDAIDKLLPAVEGAFRYGDVNIDKLTELLKR